MSEDVKRWLGAAVDAEPPLTLDRAAVYGEGKRLVRRRRRMAAGAVAGGVIVLAAGVGALTGLTHGTPDVRPAQPTVVTSEDIAPPGPLLPLPPSTPGR